MSSPRVVRTASRLLAAFVLAAAAGLAQEPSSAAVQAPSSAPEEEPAIDAASSAQPADPRTIVGPPRGTPLTGDALETRTVEVAALLRCPVCQGLSVSDSPAEMAVNMKAQVREMLGRGYTEEQILEYFEGSYGEFVRLEPPLRGVNWLVWLAPGAGLLLGAAFVVRALRPRGVPARPVAAIPPVPTRTTLPEDPDLAPYVLRARELAYGWPDGAPPSEEA